MNETTRRTRPTRQTTPNRGASRKGATRLARARLACAALAALALLTQLLPAGGARRVARAQGEIEIGGFAAQPAAAATVNFGGLAAQTIKSGKYDARGGDDDAPAPQVEPPPNQSEPWADAATMKRDAGTRRTRAAKRSGAGAAGAKSSPASAFSGPGDPTRPPASSFPAQSDSGTHAPPDASGAVGPDKVLSTHRSNYVVQDKLTGAVLSSVSMESFWAATGAAGAFNPRALYDPYAQRWLLAAVSNARSAASSILVAVSQTSDPSGNFYLFRFDADANDLLWADYPSLGFNKNWAAVSVNLNNRSNDLFNQGLLLALAYPNLRAGTATATTFPGITGTLGGQTMQPAVTYSQTEEDEYLVSHLSSGAGTYRLSRLNGTPADPTLIIGEQKFNGLGGWTQPGGETLPQAPGAAGARKIDSPDSRAQKAVFRDGGIYYCQTVGLPAGRTAATIDRTAAQWTQLNTGGDFVQGGRVEDPTATATNGGKWYAFPSLAVNKFGDVLVGFSEFSSAQFASAGYALHAGDDPAGATRAPHIYKAGEGYYERLSPANRNLWGLYSNAQVDPSNDRDLWTIQGHAAAPAGTGTSSGRWATRWARLIPPSANGQIAFHRYPQPVGGSQVYKLNPDGTGLAQLSPAGSNDHTALWSPDGTRLVVTSYRDGGNAELYRMNADGTGQLRLTNNPGGDFDPRWSPDGSKIVFTSTRDGGYDVYVMNADGTGQTRLTNTGGNWMPSWSPDGRKIVFVNGGNGEIYSMNADGTGQTRLTTNVVPFGTSRPVYSPDGRRIAFEGGHPKGEDDAQAEIYVMNADGTNVVRLTANDDDDVFPAWSPDGAKILIFSFRDGGAEIYVENADGGGTARLTNHTAYDGNPAWSPDGALITFWSERDGNKEIYVMNADGSGLTRLTADSGADYTPSWQPR